MYAADHHDWDGMARIARLVRERSGIPEGARALRSAVVLGAGHMGAGIAAALLPLVRVHLVDVDPGALARARAGLHDRTREAVRAGRISTETARLRLRRLTCATGLERGVDADVVIESATEDIELKRALHGRVRAVLGDAPIFASNTSAYTVRSITEDAGGDPRALALHFCHPADETRVVELAAAHDADPEAVASAHALGVLMGKAVVVVRDSPGFFLTRVLSAWFGEALTLLSEGNTPAGVDRAAERAGFAGGPFATLDRIGIDTAARVSAWLNALVRAPAPGSGILAAMAEQGRTGVRTGRGFYAYENGRRRPLGQDGERANGGRPSASDADATLAARLMQRVVDESARALQKRVVASADDADLLALLGLGFPTHTGGPLYSRARDEATSTPIPVPACHPSSQSPKAKAARSRPSASTSRDAPTS